MKYYLWYRIYKFDQVGNRKELHNFDCEFSDLHPIEARNKAFHMLMLINWLVNYLGFNQRSGPKYIISKWMTFEIENDQGLHVIGDDEEDLVQRQEEYYFMKENKFIPSNYEPQIISHATGDYKVLFDQIPVSSRFMAFKTRI